MSSAVVSPARAGSGLTGAALHGAPRAADALEQRVVPCARARLRLPVLVEIDHSWVMLTALTPIRSELVMRAWQCS